MGQVVLLANQRPVVALIWCLWTVCLPCDFTVSTLIGWMFCLFPLAWVAVRLGAADYLTK